MGPRVATLALLTAVACGALAAEEDFYVVASECKIVGVSLVDGRLSVADGDPPTFGCSRKGKNLACSVKYPSGSEPAGDTMQRYEIIGDSPPFFYFASENGATTFSVHLVSRHVVMTTRLVDDRYTAEKVCAAAYMTGSELDVLRKQQSQK